MFYTICSHILILSPFLKEGSISSGEILIFDDLCPCTKTFSQVTFAFGPSPTLESLGDVCSFSEECFLAF